MVKFQSLAQFPVDHLSHLAKELKKTVVHESNGALGTVTKGLIKELEDLEIRGQVETIQNTALLRTARILKRVLET